MGKQRFVVVSDIHGHFDELMKALDEVNFDKETDFLISLGDNWDRGTQNVKVMRFLINLPNKALIIGNHELLIEDCCKRHFPYEVDFSNGTYGTICEFGNSEEGYTFDECCDRTIARIHTFRNQMVNYFETKHFIFCHGWIPMNCYDRYPSYYRRKRKYFSMENFREATQKQWNDATWMCGPDMALNGYNNTGKVVVFGHWHCSYLWSIKEGRSEFGEDAKFDIFRGEDFIAIDACTAHSGQVNVLVIEDDFLEE